MLPLSFFNIYLYVSVSMIIYSFLIWAIKKMSPEVLIKDLSLQFSKTKLIIKNILSVLETTYRGRVNHLIILDSWDSVKWKWEGNESLLWSVLKCSQSPKSFWPQQAHLLDAKGRTFTHFWFYIYTQPVTASLKHNKLGGRYLTKKKNNKEACDRIKRLLEVVTLNKIYVI